MATALLFFACFSPGLSKKQFFSGRKEKKKKPEILDIPGFFRRPKMLKTGKMCCCSAAVQNNTGLSAGQVLE
ncbi:hypothetical protein H9X85_06940 [Anaerotignum lactatifermentans]|uniref:Secreted protein n=1 Tax=Anaerotignum lactatifermentans TaxID=160404 RepID=A0ABS2G8B9_9FIRM|nr:hypothetical protein [Anaerotignum lactatifermentans]MBM6829366.1 hypothetical protein [Anaerotignum lactatifermentans]MBM6877724.1 hypothetical protein [Anaerotignum lactatifermentans]MBM6950943.1 hypothetical protein [Anaerotignum lactatifermentans]